MDGHNELNCTWDFPIDHYERKQWNQDIFQDNVGFFEGSFSGEGQLDHPLPALKTSTPATPTPPHTHIHTHTHTYTHTHTLTYTHAPFSPHHISQRT